MEKKIDLLIEIPGFPSLFQVSPGSLSDLISKISSSSQKSDSCISVLFNRKGSWFKISDNDSYLSLISKSLSQNLDELELKVEFSEPFEDWDVVSSLNQTVSEELKSLEIKPEPLKVEVEEVSKVLYRYLNSSKPSVFQVLLIDSLDLTMAELSALIVKKENLSESEWVCAFYSEDGTPLTESLSQMLFVKASSVVRFGDRVNVFIVPDFDVKSKPKLPPSGVDTLTVISKEDPNVSYCFKVDLATATVETLKQNLYHFTDIPTYQLSLKLPDTFMSQNQKLLSEYSVTSTSSITFEKIEVHYSAFSYKVHSKQSISQSSEGLRALHSFLHTFSKHGEISEKPIRESFLGYIRQFSFNNTPFLTALYLLTKQKPLSLLSSIALEEGSIQLSKTILTEVFKHAPIEEGKLLEQVIQCFALLCDLSCNPQEELSRGEVFKEYNIDCPLTLKPLEEPVLLRRTDGKVLYYEKEEVLKKIRNDEEIANVGKPKETDLKVDENFKVIVQRGKNANVSELYVWEGVFDTTKSVGQLVAEKHSTGVTLAKALELRRAYKITKPIPPL
jgi:hypothetical protein